MITIVIYLIFVIAAIFEVSGDAQIREGLENKTFLSKAIGLLLLGAYGFTINLGIYLKFIDWSFSKQLGVYVAIFALVSTLVGWLYFGEKISTLHIIGIVLITAGGFVIQYSHN
jgi:small multidrug resistance family-3 protein